MRSTALSSLNLSPVCLNSESKCFFQYMNLCLQYFCSGHYKGVNEIIVFEKDDGHYDVSAFEHLMRVWLPYPERFKRL